MYSIGETFTISNMADIRIIFNDNESFIDEYNLKFAFIILI